MSEEKPSTKNLITIIPKLIQLLEPLTAEERHRAISAAMILFGQAAPVHGGGSLPAPPAEIHDVGEGICAKAASWMKKNAITREQLDHVFSIETDAVDVIAARMPESSKRKQTVQAYVLCGVKAFLKNGELNFADSEARELCSKVGCYDAPNHATYTAGFGNFLTGSKESGWKLTNPGLSAGAQIIKQLTPEQNS